VPLQGADVFPYHLQRVTTSSVQLCSSKLPPPLRLFSMLPLLAAQGFYYANGVALSRDGSYVVMAGD